MDERRRDLRVDGLVNARDLGGLPLVDGGTTPYGVFLRSENVDAVTAEGWDALHDAGVRTVVDLRQAAERELDGGRRPDWLVTTHVDLDGLENQDFWAPYWGTPAVATAAYFLPHLAAMPERAGAVLDALASTGEGGVLFHCMAGRDRTGMVAMVLLRLVGVEPDAIVDDYLESLRLESAPPVPVPEAEQTFRAALAGLDLDAVLSAAGVAEQTRRTLETWRGSLPADSGR